MVSLQDMNDRCQHQPPLAITHLLSDTNEMWLHNNVMAIVREGAMLRPFDALPFTPWCHINAVLTNPKKDSQLRRVLMDLAWPHTPSVSVNRYTPKDT